MITLIMIGTGDIDMLRDAKFAINFSLSILLSICFILWCANCFYIGFVWTVVKKGMTTNEYLSKTFTNGVSPYDLGCARNFKRICCSKVTASRLIKSATNFEMLSEYEINLEYEESSLRSHNADKDSPNVEGCYKENDSEIILNQDLNETVLNQTGKKDLIVSPIERQDRLFHPVKSFMRPNLNESSCLTLSHSKDNMFIVDYMERTPKPASAMAQLRFEDHMYTDE